MKVTIDLQDGEGDSYWGVLTDEHKENFDTPLLFVDGILMLPFDLAIKGIVPHAYNDEQSRWLLSGSYQHVKVSENIYVEPLQEDKRTIYQTLTAVHLSMTLEEAQDFLGLSIPRIYQLRKARLIESANSGAVSRRSVERYKESMIRRKRKKTCEGCGFFEEGTGKAEADNGEIVNIGRCILSKLKGYPILSNSKECVNPTSDNKSSYVRKSAEIQLSPRPSNWSKLWGVKTG